MIETKPRFKISDPKVVAKAKAATELAEVEGLCYEYYDEFYVASFGYNKKSFDLPYVFLRDREFKK